MSIFENEAAEQFVSVQAPGQHKNNLRSVTIMVAENGYVLSADYDNFNPGHKVRIALTSADAAVVLKHILNHGQG